MQGNGIDRECATLITLRILILLSYKNVSSFFYVNYIEL